MTTYLLSVLIVAHLNRFASTLPKCARTFQIRLWTPFGADNATFVSRTLWVSTHTPHSTLVRTHFAVLAKTKVLFLWNTSAIARVPKPALIPRWNRNSLHPKHFLDFCVPCSPWYSSFSLVSLFWLWLSLIPCKTSYWLCVVFSEALYYAVSNWIYRFTYVNSKIFQAANPAALHITLSTHLFVLVVCYSMLPNVRVNLFQTYSFYTDFTETSSSQEWYQCLNEIVVEWNKTKLWRMCLQGGVKIKRKEKMIFRDVF